MSRQLPKFSVFDGDYRRYARASHVAKAAKQSRHSTRAPECVTPS
jgi:hypothetical protein